MASNPTPKSKRLGLVLRRILLIAAGLVLGLNVYRWNASALLRNELPMPFGTGVAVVLSGSMEPTISINDLVIIREADDYQVNDIVVYQSGSELIIHRIIAMDGDTVTTQGDANNIADDPISRSAIKGRFAMRLPSLGLVVQPLKTPVGTVALLVLAIALMEASWHKERSESDEELEAIKSEIRRLRDGQDPDTEPEKDSKD